MLFSIMMPALELLPSSDDEDNAVVMNTADNSSMKLLPSSDDEDTNKPPPTCVAQQL